MIADVTKKPSLLTEQSGNAGVLGCAMIAAVGSGTYAGFSTAAEHMVHETGRVEPSAQMGYYDAVVRKYLKLYENLRGLMHQA